ncbi:unnamed protein product [Lactuca saligna]|uniref:MULE transposase domain-containing protein n=1 Tax=Lactuca saligna TaxID=75948 RepID=A0AA36EC31_LACSI|nr:unnamed protein product [Lactuca saligna]
MCISKEYVENTLYPTPGGLLRGCQTSISQAWTASGVMNLWKDEDNHSSPHVFKKFNGYDVEMGENVALGGPLEEGMDDDEHVYPQIPNIFNEKIHWKEQEPVLVVCVENKENWKWFVENLAEDLQCWNDGSGLTLIYDQHKGLVEAVYEVFPIAEHRQCARHIFANFRKREDVVMGDRVEPQNDEVIWENGSEQEVGVNKVPRQVKTMCQPKRRKKSERIIKLKLAKRAACEGSSVGSPIDLD